jgi:hypothetical protein
MDQFPKDFNLATCMNIISQNQTILIKDVREVFYKKVMESVKNCAKSVELDFPNNLWVEYRVIITKELLSKFGEINVVTLQDANKARVKKTISDEANIPQNISTVIIHFQQ